jgi:hypothetical protein
LGVIGAFSAVEVDFGRKSCGLGCRGRKIATNRRLGNKIGAMGRLVGWIARLVVGSCGADGWQLGQRGGYD